MLKQNRKSPLTLALSSLIGFCFSVSSLAASDHFSAVHEVRHSKQKVRHSKQKVRHQQKNPTKKTSSKNTPHSSASLTRTKNSSHKKTINLNWWAIEGGELANAACLRKEPFTQEEMIAWLTAYAQQGEAPVAETRFNGIHFIHESPSLIRLFKDLVTYTGYKLERDSKQSIPFSSSCTQVICAAEDVFGKKTGTQLLYMLARFGVNGSHLARDRAQQWYTDELDEVLLGLAAYPDSIQQQYYNHPFVHYDRDIQIRDAQLGHQTGDANGLYSEWNTQNQRDRFISVVHERAHHFSKIPTDKTDVPTTSFYYFDKSTEWYRLSGWTSEDNDTQLFDLGPFHLTKPSFVPSVYGRTNPREDFAESVLKYRFNPHGFLELLGSEGRAKYNFIRSVVFQGIEFLSEDQCKGSFKSIKPETPNTSPEAPQNPVTPPEAPQNPVTPPEAPQNPVTPPEAPQNPVTPPEAPQNPVTPPEAPQNPVTPPEAPQNPATSEAPLSPHVPEVFDLPTITQTPQPIESGPESPEAQTENAVPLVTPSVSPGEASKAAPTAEPSPLPSIRVSAQHPLERMENLVQFLNHNLEVQLQQATSRLRELFGE